MEVALAVEVPLGASMLAAVRMLSLLTTTPLASVGSVVAKFSVSASNEFDCVSRSVIGSVPRSATALTHISNSVSQTLTASNALETSSHVLQHKRPRRAASTGELKGAVTPRSSTVRLSRRNSSLHVQTRRKVTIEFSITEATCWRPAHRGSCKTSLTKWTCEVLVRWRSAVMRIAMTVPCRDVIDLAVEANMERSWIVRYAAIVSRSSGVRSSR